MIKKSGEKHQVNHDSNKWNILLVLIYPTQKREHTCNLTPAINRLKTVGNINSIIAFPTCVLIVTSQKGFLGRRFCTSFNTSEKDSIFKSVDLFHLK